MNISSIPLLLLIASFILVPYIGLSITDIVIIDINSDKEYVVFIDALYPDGFKNIGKTVVKGHNLLYLDVSNVRQAWDKEFSLKGRHVPLTLRIAVYDNNGLVKVFVKRMDFDKLAFNKTLRLNIAGDSGSIVRASATTVYPSTSSIEPLVSAVRVLEDSYDWNATVVLAILDLDDASFGELLYRYYSNVEIGFTMYLIIPNIELAGWVAFSKSANAIEDLFIPTGGRAYVWMTFRYRWEKWRVYGPGLPPEGYIEEYIYIKDFYLDTLGSGYSKPSNAILTSYDYQESSLYEANRTDLPYFYVNYGVLERRYSSVDLVAFANTLLALSKITTSTWVSIITSIPVIGVDSYVSYEQSYLIHIDAYATEVPTMHEVNISRANVYVAGFSSFPVVYVRTGLE